MPHDPRVFVFDHASIGVADLERAAASYDAALARDPDGHRVEAVAREDRHDAPGARPA
jgi:hypothetical protein